MTTPSSDDIEIEVTDKISQEIAGHIEDLTAEQVATVLTAWNTVRGGDPVGTVRRDPSTGAIAHRISDGGVFKWRVSGPDGSVWNDMQPSLPWEVIS
jgi:hypothetical protein